MDAPVSDRTLRRYLAGALDPGRREEVEAALAASPRLRERLALLMATTAREQPSAWRLPPVGAAGPWALSPSVQAGVAMGEESLEAGDYVELRFQPPPGREDHRVVLLERGPDADWDVIFPLSRAEERALSSWRREDDGGVRVDVTLSRAGRVRLALVLLPPEVALAWDAPAERRWEPVLAALAEGRAPVATVELAPSATGIS